MENTKEEIFKIVQGIIVDKSENNLFEINLESNITTDFDFDSLDIIELCMEIEKKFDISINDSYVETWDTVENIVDSVFGILNT